MTIKLGPLFKLLLLAAMGCWLLAAAPAGAQTAAAIPTDRSIDVQLFRPAIGPRNFLTVDSPEVPGHKLVGFGLYLNYQAKPYLLDAADGSGTINVINQQLTADLSLAVGMFDRVQLGLDLPFSPVLRGDDVNDLGRPSGQTLSTQGLGDLRVELKALLVTAGDDDQFLFGVVGGATLPTGKQTAFLGDRSVTGRIKALAAWQGSSLRAALNLGTAIRKTSRLFDTELGSEVTYGAALAYAFPRRIEAILELFGRSGVSDFAKFYRDVNPVEIDLGVRLAVTGKWAVTAGGGTGLGQGIGAPRLRFLLGALFTPNFSDQDHDGVPDAVDKCVDQPEDRDGYEDDDGCPDPDNDGDGVLDAEDKCPNEPEDRDQFQDEDGCPELDNDGDGIPDINDACPNAAEDHQGKNPNDGCPMNAEDADHDGIIDSYDKCPNEPEDRDGFQDDDGCPDPDNDRDGVLDASDKCPTEAEDVDGFQDDDGCPDPDNDHDGFPDAADKCPNEPETLNGVKDDDGCPDPGDEIVHLRPRRIDLTETLVFQIQHRQARSLKTPSVAAVGAVALLLRAHPEIKKLRIQVQAEKVSTEETQRRADIVRDTLVSKGIELGRLSSLGLGSGGVRVDFVIEAIEPPAGAAPGTKPPKAGGPKP